MPPAPPAPPAAPDAPDAPLARTLAALHRAAFAPRGARPWSAGEFSALLAAPGTVLLRAPAGAGAPPAPRLLGFVLARAVAGEGEILTIAVHPSARRRGIGRRLLADLHAKLRRAACTRLFLEVAADNAPALALYAAAGYARIGLRPAYYPRESGPRADALILEKTLCTPRPAPADG